MKRPLPLPISTPLASFICHTNVSFVALQMVEDVVLGVARNSHRKKRRGVFNGFHSEGEGALKFEHRLGLKAVSWNGHRCLFTGFAGESNAASAVSRHNGIHLAILIGMLPES